MMVAHENEKKANGNRHKNHRDQHGLSKEPNNCGKKQHAERPVEFPDDPQGEVAGPSEYHDAQQTQDYAEQVARPAQCRQLGGGREIVQHAAPIVRPIRRFVGIDQKERFRNSIDGVSGQDSAGESARAGIPV
jgi:hypothetical protein